MSQALGFAQNPTDGELVYGAFVTGTTMLGVYHGYRRNQGSIGWAVGWGVFSAVLPILALPLMLAEGFAEPAR